MKILIILPTVFCFLAISSENRVTPRNNNRPMLKPSIKPYLYAIAMNEPPLCDSQGNCKSSRTSNRMNGKPQSGPNIIICPPPVPMPCPPGACPITCPPQCIKTVTIPRKCLPCPPCPPCPTKFCPACPANTCPTCPSCPVCPRCATVVEKDEIIYNY